MVITYVYLATISTEHEAIWGIFLMFIYLQHAGSSLHYVGPFPDAAPGLSSCGAQAQ